MSGSKLSEDSSKSAQAESPRHEHPLGLTVHSMPEAAATLVDQGARTRSGRMKMLFVLLICAAPVVASYITYYFVRPEARRNFADLITPQQPLPAVMATDLDGQGLSLQSLKGQWLLLAVGSSQCDDACIQRLYLLRQLRESTGKDRDRIDRVWLVTDAQDVPAAMRPGLVGTTVLRVPAESLAQWLVPQQGHALQDHIYVVDPLGNWMMRLPANLDVTGASRFKRDLERLLRASSSWDQAGRP
ncbi:MAG: hypothetical protein OEY75_05840 [Hylemonella sp.]|nr:hypothetical protein [Hylemonella sp.]MDH5708617.1 hypothetical protein [Hylemonella sp.]